MARVFPGDILDLCKDEGVKLNRQLIEALSRGTSKQKTTYEPTSVLAAIGEAGRFLRIRPNAALASGALACGEAFQIDPSFRVLRQIINSSIEREITDQMPHFTHGRRTRTIEACPAAETGFSATVQSMEHFIDGYDVAHGGQIILDGVEPVLLRKSSGVKTSLALKPVNINGVIYPAGSLLRTISTSQSSEERLPRPPTGTIELASLDCVDTALFGRLTAFAVPPEEREEIFPAHKSWKPHEAIAIQSTTIEYISQLACKAAEVATDKEDRFYQA